MADSSFVFEKGDPIEVGSHGSHSYTFHSGDPVLDEGGTSFVFESGTALGGALNWNYEEKGETVVIGENPRIKVDIDGSGGASFPVAYRTQTLPSPPWVIEWGSVSWTRNSDENNFQFGATEDTSSRLFGLPSGSTIEYGQLDPANPNYPADFLRIYENGSIAAESLIPSLSIGGFSMSLEWDPPEARLYADGSLLTSLSHSYSSPPSFRGGIEVEDDDDTEDPETLRVDGYAERSL